MKTKNQVLREFAIKFNSLMEEYEAYIAVIDKSRSFDYDGEIELEIPSKWSAENLQESESVTLILGKYCDKIDLSKIEVSP